MEHDFHPAGVVAALKRSGGRMTYGELAGTLGIADDDVARHEALEKTLWRYASADVIAVSHGAAPPESAVELAPCVDVPVLVARLAEQYLRHASERAASPYEAAEFVRVADLLRFLSD